MPNLPQRRLDCPLFLIRFDTILGLSGGYALPSRGLDLGVIVIYLITVIISREPFCDRRGPPRNHDLGSPTTH